MDNIAKFLGMCIVFPLVYMFVTLNLGDSLGDDTVRQLNFGLIIGVLLYLAFKKRN